MKKEDLLRILWEAGDGFVSGSDLAQRLGVSRTAVWKGIGQLREDRIFDWRFVCLSHNTVRGAAGGGILTAELLCRKGWI